MQSADHRSSRLGLAWPGAYSLFDLLLAEFDELSFELLERNCSVSVRVRLFEHRQPLLIILVSANAEARFKLLKTDSSIIIFVED